MVNTRPDARSLPNPSLIFIAVIIPYETLRVFVTCTKAEQTRRLQAREGARYADFAARWVPLEEGYFAQYGIAESADFVVETTQGGTI